jgi:hypothetical protein
MSMMRQADRPDSPKRTVDILLSNVPTKITWSGKRIKLESQGLEVETWAIDLFVPYCSFLY